ncbi:MAG: hypothetical protein ABIJ16_07820 [Bacteroidota bacterium]
MDFFWSFLTVLVSSTAILLTAYFILKNFTEKELHKRKFDVKMKNQQMVTPIRLQAYERLVLFLERIEPGSVIRRLQHPDMKARQLQSEIITTIRAEFEHNLAQQIYISQPAWEVVKSAKENTIRIINEVADEMNEGASAAEYGTLILTRIMDIGKSPSEIAVEYLKKEVGQYF